MRGDRLLRSRLRESFVVTLKSGAAFSGVLYAQDARTLILRDVQALAAGENQTNVPVDGELVLFIADVAYLQRP